MMLTMFVRHQHPDFCRPVRVLQGLEGYQDMETRRDGLCHCLFSLSLASLLELNNHLGHPIYWRDRCTWSTSKERPWPISPMALLNTPTRFTPFYGVFTRTSSCTELIRTYSPALMPTRNNDIWTSQLRFNDKSPAAKPVISAKRRLSVSRLEM